MSIAKRAVCMEIQLMMCGMLLAGWQISDGFINGREMIKVTTVRTIRDRDPRSDAK